MSGAQFQVAVVSRAPGGRVLYRSSDTFTPAPGAHADATADLFSIRTQDFSRVASEVHRFTAYTSTLKLRTTRTDGPEAGKAGTDKRPVAIVVERTAGRGQPSAALREQVLERQVGDDRTDRHPTELAADPRAPIGIARGGGRDRTAPQSARQLQHPRRARRQHGPAAPGDTPRATARAAADGVRGDRVARAPHAARRDPIGGRQSRRRHRRRRRAGAEVRRAGAGRGPAPDRHGRADSRVLRHPVWRAPAERERGAGRAAAAGGGRRRRRADTRRGYRCRDRRAGRSAAGAGRRAGARAGLPESGRQRDQVRRSGRLDWHCGAPPGQRRAGDGCRPRHRHRPRGSAARLRAVLSRAGGDRRTDPGCRARAQPGAAHRPRRMAARLRSRARRVRAPRSPCSCRWRQPPGRAAPRPTSASPRHRPTAPARRRPATREAPVARRRRAGTGADAHRSPDPRRLRRAEHRRRRERARPRHQRRRSISSSSM